MLNYVATSTWVDADTSADVASLDAEQVVRLAEKEPVEIAVTLDGATFTSNAGHVSVGLKMVDSRSTNPIDQTPLFVNNTGYQSVDYCFPIRTAIAKESNHILSSVFAEVYQLIRKIGKECLEGIDGQKDIMPLRIVAPHDGKACIEVMGRGGGAKVTEHFCPYCTICSSELLKGFSDKKLMCDACKQSGKSICRHWAVEDEAVLKAMEEQLST